MALTSFTLRKTITGLGSYTRGDSSRLDSSLRADGYTQTVPLTTTNNSFSANLISTTTVRLSWSLSEPLVDENTITSGQDPTQLVIVSSKTGEPVTLQDGLTIKVVNYNESLNTFDDVPAVPAGRWVYYALFVRYSDGNDHWYERVATLYIQIPINYNLTEAMWKHIPEYYKSLDVAQPKLSNDDTFFHSYISLFGAELDRMRTLIESIPLSIDPSLAPSPALEQLALQMGVEIGINDLGTTKLRNLLSNIGKLRQQKGTIGSIVSYITALSGCRVKYEFSVGAPKEHIFRIYAQRINYISNPIFNELVNSTTSNTVTQGATTYYATQQLGGSAWGLYTYGASSMGASVSVVQDSEGLTITMPPGSYGTHKIMLYSRKSFPYLDTQQYTTSFDVTMSAGASFNNFHTALNTTRTSWETGIAGGTLPSTLYADSSWNTAPKFTLKSTVQRYDINYLTTASATGVATTVVPVLEFQATPGATIRVGRWLLEFGSTGSYFDGNTREGGFIPVNLSVPGTGTFDYYWGNNGVYSDYSYYLLDHERTIKTTERVLEDYIIPVTMLSNYTLDWNYYPQ